MKCQLLNLKKSKKRAKFSKVMQHTETGVISMAEKRVFKISGMRCTACSGNVEKRLKKLDGVISAEVSFSTALCTVYADEKSVPDSLVIETAAKLGFSAERFSEEKEMESCDEQSELRRKRFELLLCVCGAVPVMLISMTHLVPGVPGIVLQTLFTLPVIFAGRRFFFRGIPALFHGAPDMDTLIACGSGAAAVYTVFQLAQGHSGHLHFDSCVMIITLVTLGKYLEERIRHRSIDAVRSLAELIPPAVMRITMGKAEEIPLKDMKKGDIIRVTESGRIPADGFVAVGSGWVDESMFTGESIAVEKSVNSTVTGGTRCTGGVLDIKVDSIGKDTVLAGIISMVRQAQGTKAPVARAADIAAGYFAAFVLIVSAVTFAVHLICGAGFGTALNFSLAVMVVSCPCALGLATPAALAAGIGRGAESGILIKSAGALEKACKINCIAFDKTGTLTSSSPQFEKIISTPGFDQDVLLANLAAAEAGISHPLAASAAKAVEKRAVKIPENVTLLSHFPGRGIICRIQNENWLFGSRQLLEENNIDVSALPDTEKYSTVFIACSGRCAGVALFLCNIGKNAAETVKELHKSNIRSVILSGDRPEAVSAVARELAIDEFYAGLLPQDKLRHIKELKNNGLLAMVGDGVNDAPALAQADIGIAVGKGAVQAHEAADIVIAGDDIMSVWYAVKLSCKVMRVIKQNLFWAFFYNLLAIPMASGVFHVFFGTPALSPAFCAGAMAASSLSVVLNAARLKGVKL